MKRKEQDVRKALKELEDARKELQRIQEMQQAAKLKVLEASKSLKLEAFIEMFYNYLTISLLGKRKNIQSNSKLK